MKQSPVPQMSLLLAAGLLLALSSIPSLADDPGTAQSAAAPPTAPAGPSSQAWADMNAHMTLMHEQMAKIQAATDPKVRADLLDQHLKTMQETMKLMMGNNAGCPMAGGGGPGMRGRGGPMMNGGTMPMQGGRMGNGMMGGGNMMQLMLEQMAQHQNALQNSGK